MNIYFCGNCGTLNKRQGKCRTCKSHRIHPREYIIDKLGAVYLRKLYKEFLPGQKRSLWTNKVIQEHGAKKMRARVLRILTIASKYEEL